MKKLLLTIVCITSGVLSHAQQLFVGGDLSVLQSYEDNNVAYYDQQGAKINDVLKYVKSEVVGWNAVRVRLFVNPTRTAPNKDKKTIDGTVDAQVCQDLNYVVRFCKRVKAEGLALMLDFHYSDTWADPSNQWTPKAWLSLNDAQLQTKVYEYTKECLQRLVDEGAMPDFIQTGNEISYGMLWGAYGSTPKYLNSDANWNRFKAFLTQAAKACREVCPEAKIVIHSERTHMVNTLIDFYSKLSSLDYDIIGLSYYPFWQKDLSVLGNSLNKLEENFPNKKVQIVETGYYYQYEPTGDDKYESFRWKWPINTAGQASFARDLVAELKKHGNVNGLYWWFPEENGNGPWDSKLQTNAVLTSWVNRGLWNNDSHKAHPALYVLKDFAPEAAGVGSVVVSHVDQHWYNLQGMRLDCQPQRRGLYIIGGKKVIIR